MCYKPTWLKAWSNAPKIQSVNSSIAEGSCEPRRVGDRGGTTGERNNGRREIVNKAWGCFLIIKNNNKPKVNSQIQNELCICQFNVRLYNKYPGSKVYLCSLKRDLGDFFLFYFTFYWNCIWKTFVCGSWVCLSLQGCLSDGKPVPGQSRCWKSVPRAGGSCVTERLRGNFSYTIVTLRLIYMYTIYVYICMYTLALWMFVKHLGEKQVR